MNKDRSSSTRTILLLVILILLLVMALGVMVYMLYGLNTSTVPSRSQVPAQTILSAQPAPTLAPTQEPTAAPTATALPVQTIQAVSTETAAPTPIPTTLPDFADSYYDSYFDDAVFVGDSVTQGLQIYAMYRQGLGDPLLGHAKFLAAASYNLATAGKPFDEHKQVNLTYQGTAMSIEDALIAMEAKHMFVMLGLNDWAGSAVNANIALYRAMLERVLAAVPDLRITVMGCTPITPGGEKDKLTSAGMDRFNEALQELCKEMGLEYLDVGTALKNEEGKLDPAYSSDNYVHLNNDGLAIWARTLRGYALWHQVAVLKQEGYDPRIPQDAPARDEIFFLDPNLPDELLENLDPETDAQIPAEGTEAPVEDSENTEAKKPEDEFMIHTDFVPVQPQPQRPAGSGPQVDIVPGLMPDISPVSSDETGSSILRNASLGALAPLG